MTPRTVVKIGNAESSIQDFYNDNKNIRYSRIPIYSENQDNIIGIVLRTDILNAIIIGAGKDKLETIKRPVLLSKRS